MKEVLWGEASCWGRGGSARGVEEVQGELRRCFGVKQGTGGVEEVLGEWRSLKFEPVDTSVSITHCLSLQWKWDKSCIWEKCKILFISHVR